jgi:uncharacterized coiled-coil protein SlyX
MPNDLLAKLERDLSEAQKEVVSLQLNLARVKDRVAEVEKDVAKMDSEMIPPAEYKYVKSLVFGAVAIILTAVIGAIVALVVKK